MDERAFPAVAAYPLPTVELRAPLKAIAEGAASGRSMTFPDTDDLCEAMTPLISAAIARKARQRRYTP